MRILRAIALLTALGAKCVALLAQEGEFHEERLREGTRLFESGQFSAASEQFRIAAFGFLSKPELLSESLARQALAEEAAGRPADARTTLERFVEIERRFGSYRPERLGGLAARFSLLLGRSAGVSSSARQGTGEARMRRGGRGRPPLGLPEPRPTETDDAISPMPTATLSPRPTSTSPPSPTPTALPPTATAPLPPTATATIPPPTFTRTIPPTATRTETATATGTPNRTPRPPTATRTPRPTLPPPTQTRSPLPPTRTPIPTGTPLRRSPTPSPVARKLLRIGRYVPPEQVDRAPRIRRAVNPEYPPGALASRVRGVVVLRVLVSDAGNPIEIRVVEEARAGLTQAAIDAVRQWLFEPGLQEGSPVTTWTTIRIPFEAIPFGPETRFEEEPAASGGAVTATPVPTAGRFLTPPRVPSTPAPVPTREVGLRRAVEPEAVYRTRSTVRFDVSPEQSRVFVNDRYIGVADDWDESGGGLEFRFARRGGHLVRFELSGYRDLTIEVVVTAAAEEDTVEVDEELKRISWAPYRRLPNVSARTTGAVELAVEPAVATVSERGRTLGRASAFGPSNPLRLSGPEVHDLLFSAPGHEPRMVRVLVAPYAGVEVARVETRLRLARR